MPAKDTIIAWAGGGVYLKVNCMDEVDPAFIILACHTCIFRDQHFKRVL